MTRSDGSQLVFSTAGDETGTVDAAGNIFTIQTTSGNGHTFLGSVGTSSGRRANLSFDGVPHVREMDDPASGHHSATDPACDSSTDVGQTTVRQIPDDGNAITYCYDSSGLVDHVDDPGSAETTPQLSADEPACAPDDDGFDARCADPQVDDGSDSTEDGAATFADLPGPGGQATQRIATARAGTSSGNGRRIQVNDYATVRSSFNSYVFAEAYGRGSQGWVIYTHGSIRGWYAGFVKGTFNNCGWVQTTAATGQVASGSAGGCSTDRRIPITQVTPTGGSNAVGPTHHGINCAGVGCTQGSDLKLTQTVTTLCRDVGILPRGVTRGCKGIVREPQGFANAGDPRIIPAGKVFQWRFVSRDGKWVMGRDTPIPKSEERRAAWVWVPRSQLPARLCPRVLHGHEDPGSHKPVNLCDDPTA